MNSDKIFNLAADIVCNTSQSVFLTGKAGTGKTTFLHYINKHASKNIVVAAPTGIAAINAGGVTLHSLLQLPFEPFEPTFEGKKKLDFHLKIQKSKIELLRELDLLIIDEVSMLRSDTLDAIDYIFKRYRNNEQPFGGLQILFIGDLFQLPPVVQKQEWERLKVYYPSPFFYDAYALDDHKPLYIELKQVYRQTDDTFVGILNRIRNNSFTTNDLDILNNQYNPLFQLPPNGQYIVLCTHNHKADKINTAELTKLQTEQIIFRGDLKGDFNESSLPTDLELTLKVGAQIMFVKNDSGEKRRYYNGKLAIISKLSTNKVFVRFDDESEIEVEKEIWRNIRYTLDEDSGNVQEKELGNYIQYPIRLAWAITIHKSQGLTFNKVIIDAGQSFAAGQVYVALSRCRSLDGIVLYSKITAASIQTDQGAISYTNNEVSEEFLIHLLNDQKPSYCADQLKKRFDWLPVVRSLYSFCTLVEEKKIPDKEQIKVFAYDLYNKALDEQSIARNFQKELKGILATLNLDEDLLQDRVGKAALYFHKHLLNNIVKPLKKYIDDLENVSKIKQFKVSLKQVYVSLTLFLLKLENIYYGDFNLTQGLIFESITIENKDDLNRVSAKEKTARKKGDSERLTFELFKAKNTIPEIARIRNLAQSTIESHLSSYVLTGDINAKDLVTEDKLNLIISKLDSDIKNISFSVLKDSLPNDYSYFDIRVVINYLKYLRNDEN